MSRLDISVKCTRCRNVHKEADREQRLNSKYKGLSVTDSCCPCCGCKSYYDMTPQVAWCWASGLIEIGDALPQENRDGSGAIKIATGPKYAIEGQLAAVARHSRGTDTRQLLVPGVPEAESQWGKLAALEEWLARLNKRKSRDGVVFAKEAT